MRIRRPPAADQARLLNHMPEMVAVTNAAWFWKDKHILRYLSCRAGRLGQALLREYVVVALCTLCLDHCYFAGEYVLHVSGIGCG